MSDGIFCFLILKKYIESLSAADPLPQFFRAGFVAVH